MKYFVSVSIVIVACLALAITPIGIHSAVSSSDIIHNFNYLHNRMVGGHGARLVDADVRPVGLYARHMQGNGRQIPRYIGFVDNGAGTACTSSCTITDRHDLCEIELNVIRLALGHYQFTYEETGSDCYTEAWTQDSTLRPVMVVRPNDSTIADPITSSVDIEWAADHTLLQGDIYTTQFIHGSLLPCTGACGPLTVQLLPVDTAFSVTVW